jgi:energy-coupling factor transport system permease protein
MQLVTPLVPDPAAPLARANPVAKLGAALIVMIALFTSLDGVTALVVLAALLSLVPFSGLSPRALLRRFWLLGATALSIAVVNVLFAPQQLGPIVISVGPITIGAETLFNGVGLALRLLAIALAGILATATTQPTDLADALVQQLRVSPRFAVGALAALRLLPLMGQEWQTIAMARRARGVDAGRNPFVAVGLSGGKLLSLLVRSVRRGGRMALAMEARGFGALPCRSAARIQRMRAADWGLLLGALALGVGAIAVSVLLGTWRPLIG